MNKDFTLLNSLKRVTAFLLFMLSANLFAQVSDSYYLPSNISYNSKIPTPQQYLGFQVGEWHI